jgi:hypothetical protein
MNMTTLADASIKKRNDVREMVSRETVRNGGIDSTPSFFLMSDKLENYRPRVLTFKERRPHKALDFDEVSRDDLQDLIAYIGSLERL